MKKRHIFLLLVAFILLAGMLWLIWGNVTVGLTTIIVAEENLPSAFDGYRIAHVSDLHNSWLWEKAITRLKEAQPDIICITGDLVDSRRTDVETSLAFAAEAVKIAPCYYVTGNHEGRLSGDVYTRLIDGLVACGVIVLMDTEVLLDRSGETISLTGHSWGDTDNIGALANHDGYKILLSHQPEDFPNYATGEYDLVFSGHAHGGQFRLPFIGGLFAPGQGIFPEYDSGIYCEGRTDMVVSRGIGNSAFPIRFHNRPEVILIELKCG